MKKWDLFLAIGWSVITPWWIYRFLTNLPEIAEQPLWITVMDVVQVVCAVLVTICYWVRCVKAKKQNKSKTEDTNNPE